VSRRLGERREYEPKVGLARAVHDDYHSRTVRVRAARYFEDGDLSQDDHSEPLPAGPEGASIIQPGGWHWGSHHFPRPHILEAIETDPQSLKDIATVWAAWAQLRDYEPHGEILAELVRLACVHGEVTYRRGHNWMHRGRAYKAAVEMAGNRDKLWGDLTVAWGVIAVLAVEAPVLRRAQDAGAVDERAVAWARGRGLI